MLSQLTYMDVSVNYLKGTLPTAWVGLTQVNLSVTPLYLAIMSTGALKLLLASSCTSPVCPLTPCYDAAACAKLHSKFANTHQTRVLE